MKVSSRCIHGRLTEAKSAHRKDDDRDQWMNDGNGLSLRIRKGGGKAEIIRCKFDEKDRENAPIPRRRSNRMITRTGSWPAQGRSADSVIPTLCNHDIRATTKTRRLRKQKAPHRRGSGTP